MSSYVVIEKTKDDQFQVRRVAANNETLHVSERYTRKQAAQEAAKTSADTSDGPLEIIDRTADA